ncbi:hypothetical protein ACIHFD_31535 [Nonomuraea sp. NPDC051941]|uniref:hypothetical protein n=1 Tax=Nonomuraea sp. NPDC051941 TaxID=3364373 RepID=UPI0037C4F2D3
MTTLILMVAGGLLGWSAYHKIPEAFAVAIAAAIMVLPVYLVASGEGRTQAEEDPAKEDPAQVLRRRVQAVNQAFTEAVALMDLLRRDLDAQQAAREALLAEAERQQRLLELNEEEAEKIRQILIGETKASIRAGRRRELRFFLAGILLSAALSIPIGIWVNSIS